VQPTHIFHADWGAAPNKRWLAQATRGENGRYTASAPNLVQSHEELIPSFERQVGNTGCAVVGFDFPIGIPAAYARLAGISDFKTWLRALGHGEWADFYDVAQASSEISIRRPFYPFKPGRARQVHILSALGLNVIDELRRKCEKKQNRRRAACPLFWTLGANQVGKGAIVGWRDVLTPAIRDENAVSLWPFDGRLDDLLMPGRIVVAETYPAECYGWFFPEPLQGKGKPGVRRQVGSHLLRWANSAWVELESALASTIERGFPEGDDAFDAVVGLFGMIEVVTRRRLPGDPSEDRTRKVEGWILGQVDE
jgi:hypothetical protein